MEMTTTCISAVDSSNGNRSQVKNNQLNSYKCNAITRQHTDMSTPPYPPNFLQALLETSNYLESCRSNDGISKEELIHSMENRISLLIGKAVSAPTGASFSIFNRGDKSHLSSQDNPV